MAWIALLGLTACDGGSVPPPGITPNAAESLERDIETNTVLPATVSPSDVATEEQVTTGETVPGENTKALSPAQTEAIEIPAPEIAAAPVRQGLEATDPASVKLASGEVQLVEFFAFW
jgi:hypothetical protein